MDFYNFTNYEVVEYVKGYIFPFEGRRHSLRLQNNYNNHFCSKAEENVKEDSRILKILIFTPNIAKNKNKNTHTYLMLLCIFSLFFCNLWSEKYKFQNSMVIFQSIRSQ